MNHITIGVYSDDSYKVNIVKEEDLNSHIEYNKTFRFGRALFVDGLCVNKGYLSKEKVNEWTDRIKTMNIDKSKPSYPYV